MTIGPGAAEIVWMLAGLFLYVVFIGGIVYAVVHFSRRTRRRDEVLERIEARLARIEEQIGSTPPGHG